MRSRGSRYAAGICAPHCAGTVRKPVHDQCKHLGTLSGVQPCKHITRSGSLTAVPFQKDLHDCLLVDSALTEIRLSFRQQKLQRVRNGSER